MKPKHFLKKLMLNKSTVAHLGTRNRKKNSSNDDQSTPKRYYCITILEAR